MTTTLLTSASRNRFSFHLPVKHRDNRPGIPPPIFKFIQLVSGAAFAMCSAFHQTLHYETLLHHRRSFVSKSAPQI